MNLKVVGRPLGRIEGPEKVGGETLYTADVQLPGLLWGKCLRSPFAHARIVRVNTERAKTVRGVAAILTGRDVPPFRVGLSLQDTPVLAQGKVRFVGEKVAAVVAQIAEVEVDEETGHLKVRRITTAHDVGTIINPLTHQGQIEGGVIQGLGYATMEEVVAESGKVVTASLGDYRIPCTKDLPELKTVLVEDPAGPGPFAAKQIGENGIIATAGAIANALHDAVGVRLFDLPLTAEKIYFALKSSRSAA
jgi:CO/xanthine dehydrogenase Mo-binding subunit